jgi:CheY-like chemotaxis protein
VQVIANLLNNAAKYTRGGGNILVRLETRAEQVMLVVQDDGIGIEPELLSHVFELFTQAKRSADRSQGGLGIGLSLVKGLVELHGGSVSVESAGIDAGTQATVCLPRHIEPQLAALPEDGDGISRAVKALRIMIVDDNQDAALMLAMFLEEAGHHVLTEHGAHRALERASIETPDVWLLDIGLPNMDGHALARRLRATPGATHAVLIAITGYGQDQDRQIALEAGFDYFLVKPVDTKKLNSLLAGLGEAMPAAKA